MRTRGWEGTVNLTHEIERSALFIIKRARALVKFNVKPPLIELNALVIVRKLRM